MIFWSTEGNIMSTSPSISKSTEFCKEWNFVQNMILYSTENPFFEMVFSNMVGWVGELKYEIFSQDFIKLQNISSFQNLFFDMVFSNMVGWVGKVKYQLFSKDFIKIQFTSSFFKITFSKSSSQPLDGRIQISSFFKRFHQITKIYIKFFKIHFSTWSSQIWWMGGGSKISSFFKRFYQHH